LVFNNSWDILRYFPRFIKWKLTFSRHIFHIKVTHYNRDVDRDDIIQGYEVNKAALINSYKVNYLIDKYSVMQILSSNIDNKIR
jgi:hypothetical protein